MPVYKNVDSVRAMPISLSNNHVTLLNVQMYMYVYHAHYPACHTAKITNYN